MAAYDPGELPPRASWNAPDGVDLQHRDLSESDRSEVSLIPCTSVVRTLLDLPAVVNGHRVDQAIEDALRRRLCGVEELADRFVALARRGRAGTVVMRELLQTRTGCYVPTMSELERRMAELLDERISRARSANTR